MEGGGGKFVIRKLLLRYDLGAAWRIKKNISFFERDLLYYRILVILKHEQSCKFRNCQCLALLIKSIGLEKQMLNIGIRCFHIFFPHPYFGQHK